MAKQLDEQAKKILAERLEELIDERLDVDYKLTLPKQCKQMDLSYQTLRKYLDSISVCSITNLSKIADYYGVSTDYLLGKTNTRSPNTDIQAVCNTIGLSETAISLLQKWNKSDDKTRFYCNYISLILENPEFERILNEIGLILVESSVEGKLYNSDNSFEDILVNQNEQMAKLWIIQKKFTEIIEKMSESERHNAFEKNKRGANNGSN